MNVLPSLDRPGSGPGKIMKCTEMLKDEHTEILKRLDIMQETLKALPSVDRREFLHFFEFVKEYVDEFHHQKEESLYFKWMIKRNPSMEQGPIACMLSEHDQGRKLLSNAISALEVNNTRELSQNISDFIDLLRGHIEKENNVLYKMADDIDSQTEDGDNIMFPAFQDINKNLAQIPRKFGIATEEVNSGCCGSCS